MILRREHRKIARRWEKARQGSGYRTVTRFCVGWRVVPARSGASKGAFHRRADLDAQKQRTGLARGRDGPFTAEVTCLEREPTTTCPVGSLRSDHPGGSLSLFCPHVFSSPGHIRTPEGNGAVVSRSTFRLAQRARGLHSASVSASASWESPWGRTG